MSSKWRGPWIGKSRVVPAPTGTFRLKPDAITATDLFASPSSLAIFLSMINDVGNPGSTSFRTELPPITDPYNLRATFDPALSIYLDSDVVPTAIGDLPAGFFVVSATIGSASETQAGLAPAAGCYDVFYQFAEANESPTRQPDDTDGVFTGFSYPVGTLGYPTMAALIADGMGLRTSTQILAGRAWQWARSWVTNSTLMNGTHGAIQLRGTYYAP
jgi:hypothetical protein